MYTEDYKRNGFFFRNLLLKGLLIIAIVFLLIWIIPKFLAYKPTNKKTSTEVTVKEENINNSSLTANLEKLKGAALLYYKDDKLPQNKNDIDLVNLRELRNQELVTKLTDDNNKTCDVKKSYAKITKLTDDYLLKLYINCNGKTDYLLVHVGKYDYCTNDICEKDATKTEEKQDNSEVKVPVNNTETKTDTTEEEKKEDTNTDNNTNNAGNNYKLSGFSNWTDFTKTNCNTKEVICSENDFNCLTEVRIKKQTEQVGTYNKEYYTTHLVLDRKSTSTVNACSNYNYISIQNVVYKTTGDYEEILSLNNRQSTANWVYKETISTTSSPNFGSNKYYKYVGADFKDCTYTCTGVVSYYYDVYEYIKPITKASNLTEGCSGITQKTLNTYSIVKKKETAKRAEPLYATACYQSVRTRKVIK